MKQSSPDAAAGCAFASTSRGTAPSEPSAAPPRGTRSDRVSLAPAADRILILRLGAMGDVIRTLPSAAAIRSIYPGSHLTWLVEPASAGVVEAAGIVDETLVFPRTALMEALYEADGLAASRRLVAFLRTLRQRRFGMTLDFHGLLKTGVLARLSGAPIRLGFAPPTSRELSSLFSNRLVPAPWTELSRFDRNGAMIRHLSPETPIPDQPLLSPSDLARSRLAARLRAAGREHADGFALVHPGSSAGAQHKRYAPEAWVSAASVLAAEGIEVWVAAGPNRHERNLAEDIVRRASGSVVLAPETRSFDDLLALQARAAVVIACDSGPLHAASLAGIPVVQLLGPTHPRQNEPWRATPSRRLWAPLPCSPCRRGCADPACMRSIPPEAVAERALELLREDGPLRDAPGKRSLSNEMPEAVRAVGPSDASEPAS